MVVLAISLFCMHDPVITAAARMPHYGCLLPACTPSDTLHICIRLQSLLRSSSVTGIKQLFCFFLNLIRQVHYVWSNFWKCAELHSTGASAWSLPSHCVCSTVMHYYQFTILLAAHVNISNALDYYCENSYSDLAQMLHTVSPNFHVNFTEGFHNFLC